MFSKTALCQRCLSCRSTPSWLSSAGKLPDFGDVYTGIGAEMT